ncbi:efhc2 [Symbiodinium sp. CCMP2456]|nr:efhc2 [Symbiodinium sp. CCMP2456]
MHQETVTERPDENCRKRNVVIMYYLEDGTMSMSEPRIENSGIVQGLFLRRQRVERPEGGGIFKPSDFRCGMEVSFFGRTYHITGCDRFTRWYFSELGLEAGEDEEVLDDAWHTNYKLRKCAERGALPSSKFAVEQKTIGQFQMGAPPVSKKLTQFVLNDRKVLRFKGYWDDNTLYGARIYFNIHYYLADNTMEFNEAHCRNSGRYPAPIFFKRGVLKKKNVAHCVPAMLSDESGFYRPEDLRVGESIDVWGRKVVLFDCDDFTQKFYKDYMGINQRDSVIDVSEKPMRHLKLLPPPHQGVGKEEDSLISCKMINVKPPKVDLEKLMVYTGEVLRFEAKMINGQVEDEMRLLVIAFYPHDDEVAVFEVPVRNSGHWTGKFADKRRMINPATGQRFKLSDLRVGTTVTMAGQPLYITRADERCLQFLEARPKQFPYADPIACAKKLAALKGEPEMEDPDGVDPDRLKELALSLGLDIVDHEIVTVLRRFGVTDEDGNLRILGPAVLETAAARERPQMSIQTPSR